MAANSATIAGGGAASELPRALTILVTATAVLAPLSLILYQSFLSAPFFEANKELGLDAYRFVFADADFWQALVNSLLIAGGMTLIAVPLGALLAFVMERTDLPAKRWLEPLILVPSFVSPMVLAFGFVVAAGPVGFYTVFAQETFGAATCHSSNERLRQKYEAYATRDSLSDHSPGSGAHSSASSALRRCCQGKATFIQNSRMPMVVIAMVKGMTK